MRKRCIYSYEFDDNCAYIGLTGDIKTRKNNHKKSGSVYKHTKICNIYKFSQLTDFIDSIDAKNMEIYFIEKYRTEGWNILNETGGGSLGGNILKWNIENCRLEAQKYNRLIDFQKSAPGCYKRCRIEGWLYELTTHMENGYIKWTKEKCIEDTKNYESYSQYREISLSYCVAVRDNFLNEICDIFKVEKQKYKKYWTKDKCQEEALKYNYRNDFCKNSKSAYCMSHKNNWLDDITKHMLDYKKFKGYWTKERCQEEALKFDNLKDFQNLSKGAYSKCFLNNWLSDVCEHMSYKKRTSPNHWNKENCKLEAEKYKNRTDFSKKSKGAYKSSRKNGWLDEICSHMEKS